MAEAFLAHVGKPLPAVTLGDVVAFAEGLTGLKDSSRAVTVAAVRSLLSFGHRTGYLLVNVGTAVEPPRVKDDLARRILDESSVYRLLDREPDLRNRLLLRLLYATGLRVSEACSLTWHDVKARDRGRGQATVYGKGGKTRVVVIPAAVWHALQALVPEGASGDPAAPVFA